MNKWGARKLENIFMQAVPLEHCRMPKPYTADTKTCVTHEKEKMNGEGEKRDSIGPHQIE